MTPHEQMRKHLQKVAGGGIAWERDLFSKEANSSSALLDAAVDIAWERLMPNTLERPVLDVRRHGSLIVFRVKRLSLDQMLQAVA